MSVEVTKATRPVQGKTSVEGQGKTVGTVRDAAGPTREDEAR